MQNAKVKRRVEFLLSNDFMHDSHASQNSSSETHFNCLSTHFRKYKSKINLRDTFMAANRTPIHTAIPSGAKSHCFFFFAGVRKRPFLARAKKISEKKWFVFLRT
jgi:hypothetical protein